MKKLIFLILTSFLIFSCTSQNNNQKNISWTWEIGNIWKNEKINSRNTKEKENIDEELKKCQNKSPFRDKTVNINYWIFKNKNDNLCYYLGFDGQFFLVNEKLKEYLKNDLEKNIETWYFLKNNWESDEKLLEKLSFNFSSRKYNLLYWDYIDKLLEKIKKYKFQEAPIMAIFQKENILDFYLTKFKDLKIILPKEYFKFQWKASNNKDFYDWVQSQSDHMKFFEKEFNPPKYLLDLDIENLYHILYEKQQKELEK